MQVPYLCPSRVPLDLVPTLNTNSFVAQSRDGYVIEGGGRNPSFPNQRTAIPVSHWVFVATQGRPLLGTNIEHVGRLEVRGHRATLLYSREDLRQGAESGLLSGHLILLWREGRFTYEVTFHVYYLYGTGARIDTLGPRSPLLRAELSAVARGMKSY